MKANSSNSPLSGVRIVFVLPSFKLGGAERQAFLLARHLRRHHRADVHVVSLMPDGPLVGDCEAESIPHSFFELKHTYRDLVAHANDLRRFAMFLRRRRPAILLPYCMYQNILCGLTWRAGGARVAIWNQRDEGRGRVARWIERVAVGQYRRFVSNSTHGAQFLTDTLGVTRERIDVVFNGVELPACRPPETDWRRQLGLQAESFAACMVANLHGKKDHATLITAWRRVVDRWPNDCLPHLLLAGEWCEQYEPLLRQVQDLQLDRQVHFLGTVRDAGDLLRTVDLAVFSSCHEGLPNAILEAMSHGLAIVATDQAGIREALGAIGTPLLAAPGDPADLADKILLAAASHDLRRSLGEAGKRRVREVFEVDHACEHMAEIIVSEWRSRQSARMTTARVHEMAQSEAQHG